MGTYLLTEPAKRDIRQIVDYIRPQNARAAVKVREELQNAMRRLADFPNTGHFRADLADESLRVWSVYSYLIVYRPDVKPIQVLRIIHGAQELQRFVFGS